MKVFWSEWVRIFSKWFLLKIEQLLKEDTSILSIEQLVSFENLILDVLLMRDVKYKLKYCINEVLEYAFL